MVMSIQTMELISKTLTIVEGGSIQNEIILGFLLAFAKALA